MDRTYPQRLHKHELVLRGFFLNALRLQLRPFKDFFVSHGYLGSPNDLIKPQSLKTAYIDSYMYISDAEMYNEWRMQEYDYKNSQKDGFIDDGFLIVSETLKSFFLQASLNYYNTMGQELTDTSIEMLDRFIKNARSNGASDSDIISALDGSYNNDLRIRAGVIGATEASTIFNLVKRVTAAKFFNQKGIVGYKTWLTRLDELVRHTHEEVEKRTIPLDSKFVLNKKRGGIEFADQPCDPVLSAANRINCRCVCDYHSDPDKYKEKGGL